MVGMCGKEREYPFKKKLEDISPFCGANDTLFWNASDICRQWENSYNFAHNHRGADISLVNLNCQIYYTGFRLKWVT